MREILFRGKWIGNGEWVYGFPMIMWGRYHIISRLIKRIVSIVNPSTIGQYTGLTDKNGVKIFDGDILKTTNSNCAIWFVDYKSTAFCANQANANFSCTLDSFIAASEVEVIGNVHDNPELLETEGQT